MKGKIIAFLLLVSLFIPQSVFADEEFIYQDVKAVYGWRMQNSGYEYDESTGLKDTVNYVNDAEYGRVLMVDKQSATHYNSWKGIIQDIPTSILQDGHTYVVEYDMKMTNDITWVKTGFNAPKGYSEPYGPNCTSWARRSNRYTYDSSTYTKEYLEVVFYNTNNKGKFWLANVTVYDEQDPQKTNLLVNGDFSYDYTTITDIEFSDGILTWTVPENIVADGINVYKRQEDGTSIKLNESIIPITDQSASFDISAENSYYIDVYSCLGDIEINWHEPAVQYVLGKTDMYDYKFYSEGEQIDTLNAGNITVSLPFRNNYIDEGYEFEIIVLLKDGEYTKRVAKSAFSVMPSEDIKEYSTDITVDGEINENTRLEVYLWDSIDGMNVLRDVYTFGN